MAVAGWQGCMGEMLSDMVYLLRWRMVVDVVGGVVAV